MSVEFVTGDMIEMKVAGGDHLRVGLQIKMDDQWFIIDAKTDARTFQVRPILDVVTICDDHTWNDWSDGPWYLTRECAVCGSVENISTPLTRRGSSRS